MLGLFFRINFLLLSLVGFSLATDQKATNHGNEVRIRDDWQLNSTNLVCFFMTSDVNWEGEAQNLCQVGGQCAGLLPDGLSSNVSSAGGNPGQTCFLYTAENCTGNSSAPINNPGYADLSAINFSNKAVSWRCYKWCGYQAPVNTTTTTTSTYVPMSTTMSSSAVNEVAVTNRDVSISTTLSPSQPADSTKSTVSISTTLSTSTSSSAPLTTRSSSAVNTVGVTGRDVSISTTLSGSQPGVQSKSAVSVSTTLGASASTSSSASPTSSSSLHASTLPPLKLTPTPISDSRASSPVSVSTTNSSSSSIDSMSTTLTSGTSSTTSLTSSPLLLPLFLSNRFWSTGTGNASATATSTSWVLLTHTFGGRGGSSTTLLSFMLTGPAVPQATATPASKR